MRHTLILHPDSQCGVVTRIEVSVMRPRADNLALRYVATGRISDVRLPPATVSARTDELWRHTCFEAFVRPSPGDAYCEFNFAPSTQWAAYRFDAYRSGMRVADEVGMPHIAVRSNATDFEIQVSLELNFLPMDSVWRLGLSAVIEDASGGRSYWVLAHPPGKPDFHHSDCFALALPAP